jgi:hypothetical protein
LLAEAVASGLRKTTSVDPRVVTFLAAEFSAPLCPRGFLCFT